ncbi:MAG: hypothetical protein ACLUSP_00645 [Christensenellales bacterium]
MSQRSFSDGANVEFVEILGRNEIKMRVYERGSGETLGCGSGACAAVAAAIKRVAFGRRSYRRYARRESEGQSGKRKSFSYRRSRRGVYGGY